MEASIKRFFKKIEPYVYIEKLPYLKFGFGRTYFLVHFTMHGP